MITTYEYGNPEADVVLIQLTGEHELAVLENEVKEIRKRASSGELDFRFIAAKVENWNDELSPWKAPAVFKNEDFGGGAAETLEKILALCTDPGKTYYIGGYSLAGLFALWAAYQTDRFSGVAAVPLCSGVGEAEISIRSRMDFTMVFGTMPCALLYAS